MNFSTTITLPTTSAATLIQYARKMGLSGGNAKLLSQLLSIAAQDIMSNNPDCMVHDEERAFALLNPGRVRPGASDGGKGNKFKCFGYQSYEAEPEPKTGLDESERERIMKALSKKNS